MSAVVPAYAPATTQMLSAYAPATGSPVLTRRMLLAVGQQHAECGGGHHCPAGNPLPSLRAHVWYSHSVWCALSTRRCYAMSGTHIAYGATTSA
eukprot:1744744-Rhodomonas_salina.2